MKYNSFVILHVTQEPWPFVLMTAAPAAMATVLARLDIAFAIHTGQEMIAVKTLVLRPLVEHVRRYLSRASIWYRIWATDMAH